MVLLRLVQNLVFYGVSQNTGKTFSRKLKEKFQFYLNRIMGFKSISIIFY